MCRLLASCRPGTSSSAKPAASHKATGVTGAEEECGEACGETPVHWNIARHPSQIPSAINLPEKARGAATVCLLKYSRRAHATLPVSSSQAVMQDWVLLCWLTTHC